MCYGLIQLMKYLQGSARGFLTLTSRRNDVVNIKVRDEGCGAQAWGVGVGCVWCARQVWPCYMYVGQALWALIETKNVEVTDSNQEDGMTVSLASPCLPAPMPEDRLVGILPCIMACCSAFLRRSDAHTICPQCQRQQCDGR